MNFKKLSRSLVCLLLVAVILVNCSPIRAEATGVEALYLSTVFVNPTIAVTAVLFGLGVMVTAAATAVFTKLVDDITVDMVDKGLISSSGVDMYRADADGAATYLVNQELVEAVRDYLWDNDVLISDGELVNASMEEFFSDPMYIGGYVFPTFDFDSSWYISRLPDGTFILTSFNGPVYGVWKEADKCYFLYSTSTSSVKSRVYRLTNYDWSYSYYSTGDHDAYVEWFFPERLIASNFEIRDKAGSILAEALSPATTRSVSVSDNLTAGQIAPQNQSFAEGYSEWASGARTLPTLRDGEKTDAESAYIALGMGLTQEETMAMTQAAVQSGVGTYENTGTTADTITASGLKGWLDTIRLSIVDGFTALKDGFKTVIAALANLPALIAGFFRTLASHFKSVFLLGSLLGVLGEYLQALFSWLPENMLAVLMLLFGISIFYKFIGR